MINEQTPNQPRGKTKLSDAMAVIKELRACDEAATDFITKHTERMARIAVSWREDLLKSLAPPEIRDDTQKTIEYLTENSVGFAVRSGHEYLFMQGYCLGRVTSNVTTENGMTRLSMALDPASTITGPFRA